MPAPQPLKLTKVELKKLRTQRRRQREMEKQELIRQGLLEPAKPKVKISNLMRVLGSEATADPTVIEKEVRAQMEERQMAHEDRNLARKLTPAERREKKVKKLFGNPDEVAATQVAVYRIEDLSFKQHIYKVDINAQENRLTGIAITVEDSFSLVIVEGSAKAIKRYNKLMLRRIDWNPVRDEDDAPEQRPVNSCNLVWQGEVQNPAFEKFTKEVCSTTASAKKILDALNVGHYWDLAENWQPEVGV
uniref:U4/U6 small nuclear ribonucleoprotein PRP3 n=2 Tax=Tetraselmis sp. GSL018 TaxID=582737 RepID=A0A061SGE1_9CHLO